MAGLEEGSGEFQRKGEERKTLLGIKSWEDGADYVEYHTAGVIGQSYAAVEGSGTTHLSSLVGWAVSLAQGENSYGDSELSSYGAGDWREEQQPAEDSSQTPFVLQSVLGYAWIDETWNVDLEGDG